MNSKTAMLVLFAICTVVWPDRASAQAAQTPSVQEIVEKANRMAYYQGKDGRAKVSMTIIDAQKRTRQKQFIIMRRDAPGPGGATDDSHCGDQKFYVYFLLPPDERKTVFMVWKHLDRDDERWLYLPALDLVKQIASAEKRTSFVGSDFFYEDVSGRNIEADTHELVETTENYYVLKNTPKDPASVEFSHYKAWIHRQTFLPVRVEYYDKNGEKYRAYIAEKVEVVQGYPTVTRAKMQNLRSGSETTIEYRDVKYDIGLPEELFTERYLRIAPQEYLK